MAMENVRKFYEKLSTNKELQEKFLSVQKGYEAEGKSEEEIIEDIIIPLAKETDCEFTMDEFIDAQRDLVAENGISEKELENVSGGWSGCFIIGASNSFSSCIIYGVDGLKDTDDTRHDGVGCELCYYVGIGFGGTGRKI